MSHSLAANFQRFSLFAVDSVDGSRNFTNKQLLLLVGLVAVPQNRPQNHPVPPTGTIDTRLLIAFWQQFHHATLQRGILHDRCLKGFGHGRDFGSKLKSWTSRSRRRHPVMTQKAIKKKSALELLYDFIARQRAQRSPRIPTRVNMNIVGRQQWILDVLAGVNALREVEPLEILPTVHPVSRLVGSIEQGGHAGSRLRFTDQEGRHQLTERNRPENGRTHVGE